MCLMNAGGKRKGKRKRRGGRREKMCGGCGKWLRVHEVHGWVAVVGEAEGSVMVAGLCEACIHRGMRVRGMEHGEYEGRFHVHLTGEDTRECGEVLREMQDSWEAIFGSAAAGKA